MLTPLVDLLLPPACALCRVRTPDASTLFCESCAGSMSWCPPPACRHGGIPASFDSARAPFLYLGPVRQAVLAFKYRSRRRIGAWLAEAMGRLAQRDLPTEAIDAVAPVPMHWFKARLRGHSAAAQLARAVARRLGRPYRPDVLARARWTSTQTRLTTRQRFRNVEGAFRARLPRGAPPRVLLIDDVLTTGATADACARALRAAGAPSVWVLTAACAPA